MKPPAGVGEKRIFCKKPHQGWRISHLGVSGPKGRVNPPQYGVYHASTQGRRICSYVSRPKARFACIFAYIRHGLRPTCRRPVSACLTVLQDSYPLGGCNSECIRFSLRPAALRRQRSMQNLKTSNQDNDRPILLLVDVHVLRGVPEEA